MRKFERPNQPVRLKRIKYEGRSKKPRRTARFRRCELVSVCENTGNGGAILLTAAHSIAAEAA